MTRLEELTERLQERQEFAARCMLVPQFQSLAPTAEIKQIKKDIELERSFQERQKRARAIKGTF